MRRKFGDQAAHAAEEFEDDENRDDKKHRELDEALESNGKHQPAMMLARMNMADAENDREQRHGGRHPERRILQKSLGLVRGAFRNIHEHIEARAHSLQLQSNIGQHTERCRDGHEGGEKLTFAVPRRDEVRDRGDVFGLGDLDDSGQNLSAEDEHQSRPDIDRDEFKPVQGGAADRSVKTPRRVVDR
ncbi:hypothetical protein [Afipia felis]|uniref:hypothetical protein n=1 Tax=Afipia felis TaxID=1035 RepID=UPI001FCEC4EB|nr:hypothetical protein [Afipia felis]